MEKLSRERRSDGLAAPSRSVGGTKIMFNSSTRKRDAITTAILWTGAAVLLIGGRPARSTQADRGMLNAGVLVRSPEPADPFARSGERPIEDPGAPPPEAQLTLEAKPVRVKAGQPPETNDDAQPPQSATDEGGESPDRTSEADVVAEAATDPDAAELFFFLFFCRRT
jgi:hypothetical protein